MYSVQMMPSTRLRPHRTRDLIKIYAVCHFYVDFFSFIFSLKALTNSITMYCRVCVKMHMHNYCIFKPRHKISSKVLCTTSKGSNQPAHTRSLIRAFASRYSINIKLQTEQHLEFPSLKGGCTGSSESTHVKIPHCWIITCRGSFIAFAQKLRSKRPWRFHPAELAV